MLGSWTLETFAADAIEEAGRVVPDYVADAFIKLGTARELAVFFYSDNPVTLGLFAEELNEINDKALLWVCDKEEQLIDDEKLRLAIVAAYKKAAA